LHPIGGEGIYRLKSYKKKWQTGTYGYLNVVDVPTVAKCCFTLPA